MQKKDERDEKVIVCVCGVCGRDTDEMICDSSLKD